MIRCPRCGREMIWGGEHSFEDYGVDDEEGIVSNLSCYCGVSMLVYTPETYGTEEDVYVN